MTDTANTLVPDTLEDMLPVGMISSGGSVAAAMASVAQAKRGLPGWEAFHYERVAPLEYEITGGIAVNIAGVKKFQGEHDTVQITETEILNALRAAQHPAQPDVMSLLEQDLLAADIGHSRTAPAGHQPKFLKVVFALPEDEAGRQRLLQAFQLQASFFGARVQACSLHDHHPV